MKQFFLKNLLSISILSIFFFAQTSCSKCDECYYVCYTCTKKEAPDFKDCGTGYVYGNAYFEHVIIPNYQNNGYTCSKRAGADIQVCGNSISRENKRMNLESMGYDCNKK